MDIQDAAYTLKVATDLILHYAEQNPDLRQRAQNLEDATKDLLNAILHTPEN